MINIWDTDRWAWFVKIWQESNTHAEVMAKTGLGLSTVTERAWLARKQGVPLKRYKGGAKAQPDWEALARLVTGPEPEFKIKQPEPAPPRTIEGFASQLSAPAKDLGPWVAVPPDKVEEVTRLLYWKELTNAKNA